jgi:hypothetical protein
MQWLYNLELDDKVAKLTEMCSYVVNIRIAYKIFIFKIIYFLEFLETQCRQCCEHGVLFCDRGFRV